jgi:hypothetical protein
VAKPRSGLDRYAIRGDSSRAVVRVKLPLLEGMELRPESP